MIQRQRSARRRLVIKQYLNHFFLILLIQRKYANFILLLFQDVLLKQPLEPSRLFNPVWTSSYTVLPRLYTFSSDSRYFPCPIIFQHKTKKWVLASPGVPCPNVDSFFFPSMAFYPGIQWFGFSLILHAQWSPVPITASQNIPVQKWSFFFFLSAFRISAKSQWPRIK